MSWRQEGHPVNEYKQNCHITRCRLTTGSRLTLPQWGKEGDAHFGRLTLMRIIFEAFWGKVKYQQNRPAFICPANVRSFGYFGCMSSSNLSRTSNWGLQFLTCGGPSSSFIRANRAADIDRPRIPSPHSFSALCKFMKIYYTEYNLFWSILWSLKISLQN